MKIEIEVKDWWIVDYQESYQHFDQREGAYTSWRDKRKRFLTEGEALQFIGSVQRERKGEYRSMTLSHVREM